jgi:hypothetical protein
MDISVDGRILLKCIYNAEWDCGLGWRGSGQGTEWAFFNIAMNLLIAYKTAQFLISWPDYKHPYNDPATWINSFLYLESIYFDHKR